MATLSDIVKVTGAKPRTVQFWADAGVIIPDLGSDREGSGRHRQFSKDEMVIACIIAVFAAEKVAIGSLRQISKYVRDIQRGDEGTDRERELISAALAGTETAFVEVMTWRDVRVTDVYDDEFDRTRYSVSIVGPEHFNNYFIKHLSIATRGKVSYVSLNSVLSPMMGR